ncbi:50S ribosome-binding GTPase, partial [bacterium]|nr:50S ribosome-binding GTPase [bacterium]
GTRQLIFVDTPGVFKPGRRLDRAMVGAAMDALSDADAVLLILDATKGITDTVRGLIQKIREHKNIFVALNKTDAVKKSDLLPMAAELNSLAPFSEIFMISALKNDGIAEMLNSLAAVMPESPYLFDAHDATDVPDNLYLAELTREKIYKYVHPCCFEDSSFLFLNSFCDSFFDLIVCRMCRRAFLFWINSFSSFFGLCPCCVF